MSDHFTPLFDKAPDTLCILRLSALGDVCNAIAAVQAIQRHWPTTKITWISGKLEAQLLEQLPDIEVIAFDKKAGLKGMQDVWAQLNGRTFDALVQMQLAFRSSILTTGIKAKYKVGFNRKRAREAQWLFTNRKIHDTQSQHVLDSFLSFAEYLGVPRVAPQWNIPTCSNDEEWLNQQFLETDKLFIISPAASKSERNWLNDRYAKMADYADKHGYRVVLCGSPSEHEIGLGKSIESLASCKITNLIGQTSLTQLMALLKRGDMVLTPDSGPAHMANAQGTPVIGLYAHSNPRRTGPYNSLKNTVNQYDTLVFEMHGRPYNELPWATRVKGHDIMDTITLESVIKKFDALVSDSAI